MANITIRDLSAATGFSNATVSLALRNHPRISEQTKSKIRAMAQSMGYRPNPLVAAHWAAVRARKPAGFQSVIGILNDWDDPIKWEDSPYAKPIIKAFRRRATELGYMVEEFAISTSKPRGEKQRLASLAATAKVFRARGIHAFAIFSSAHPQLFMKMTEHFAEFATVFVGSEYIFPQHDHFTAIRHIPYHRVGASAYSNMVRILDELFKLGYHRPGYWPNQWSEMGAGGESAAAFNFFTQNLPPKKRIRVEWAGWNLPGDFKSFEISFRNWLDQNKPDVVICGNQEVRSWIESTGRRIPEDIGLAHVDLAVTEAGWAGIDQHHDRIAMAAVDLVTAHLSRNERGLPDFPKDLRIEGKWIHGETVRPQF